MRNRTLLYGRNLLWIALQARNLNENLKNNLQQKSFCDFRDFCVTFYWWEYLSVISMISVRQKREDECAIVPP